jgi:uncharacterized protein
LGPDWGFEWNSANRDHIARHKVSPEEAEQVIRNKPLDIDAETMAGEDRVTSIGRTNAGRFLVVTTLRGARIRVVTASDAPNRLIDFYLTQTGALINMAEKLRVPKFATEAEEAQWWYDHREDLTKAFEDAVARGDLHSGSVARGQAGAPPGGRPRRF